MVPFERAVMVFYRLSIVTVALSLTIRPQFAVEYRRRSHQHKVSHFGANLEEEEVGRCKPNFSTTWKRYGAVVRKRKPFDIFCRLSTLYERDRQTDRPRNGDIDRNRRNRLSGLSASRLNSPLA